MSVDRVDINNVLAQMRAMQSQMPSQVQNPPQINFKEKFFYLCHLTRFSC